MILSQLFSVIGSLAILSAYGIYFKQMKKGKSTPNPASWGIFFLAGLVNTLTYLSVVEGNIWQSLYVITVTICLFGVVIYSLSKGNFTKVRSLEIVTFIIAIGIGIFWQIADNARVANLLLQSIYVIGYIPTYIGIINNTAKEKYTAWLLAVLGYSFATLSLISDWPSDWIAFVSPILNGILGNGIAVILIVVFLKNKKKLKSK